ncbi:MAG TPA: DUF4340 domain-containing protein, partial [Gammaproteobacteria bacterium]|nr:DUF4340 domain-containing protein [Gammaproteobacteria bacterium]
AWLLPGLYKAPADEKKVESLLHKLAALKEGLAVATTKGAAKRFKVGKDNFERHIILKAGDRTVADFFLGTSPEFRMVHARVHDRPEVVSVKLSTYEVEAQPDRWLDHQLAAVGREKINTLTMGDISLVRKDPSWSLAGLAPDQKLDPDQVNDLLEKVSTLTVDGVVDPAAGQELFKKKPALTIAMTLTDHSKRTYTFAKGTKKDDYLLKSSARHQLFKVGSYEVKELQKFSRKSLIKTEKEASAAKAPTAKASSSTGGGQ